MLSPRLIKELSVDPKANRIGLGSTITEPTEGVDVKTLSDAWYATGFGLLSQSSNRTS